MSQSIAPKNTNTIFASAGQILPISLGYYPSEGSKATSTQYNFASSLNYFEDLSRLKALGMETAIQSIWIDNSANPQAISLQIAGSGQVIVLPGYTQGVFPALFSDEAQFYISCAAYTAGTVALTKVCLLNVPVNTASIWSTQFANLPQNGSGVATSQLLGTQSFTVNNIQSAGSTIIIPAVAGKRWFMTNAYISLNYNSTLNFAGGVIFYLYDSTTGNEYFANEIYVPTAAGTTEFPANLVNVSGLNIIAGATGTALTLFNASSAFTAGGLNVTVCGGYTAYTP